MKKIFLLSVVASMILFGCTDDSTTTGDGNGNGGGGNSGPTLATTDQQNRNAVLEDFTGVRCGYCPQGHQIAQTMLNTSPDKVVVIGVNAGGYAAPAAGWANFTTSYGQAWIDQSSVKGYPAGTMNRQRFAGHSQDKLTGLAMSRGSWAATAVEVMAEPSTVNIGAEATYNTANDEIVVTVELYYTGDESANENRINVAILQSGMIAKQSGGGDNYVHKHVLRDMITGQWGSEVTGERTVGSVYKETFSYDVPTDYNGSTIPPGGGDVVPADLDIAVYVSQGNTGIITGINVPMTIK